MFIKVETTSVGDRSLTNTEDKLFRPCFTSAKDKQSSRSLLSTSSTDALSSYLMDMKEANHWYLLWMLGRLATRPTAQLMMIDEQDVLSSFTVFCSSLTLPKKASRIGYLPLIPELPTKPPVLREMMSRLVAASKSLDH